MNSGVKFRVLLFALFALILFGMCTPALAQGCALCYTQAASAGKKMIDALRSGILILVLPPTFASVGMIFIVHRKRNQMRRDEADEPNRGW